MIGRFVAQHPHHLTDQLVVGVEAEEEAAEEGGLGVIHLLPASVPSARKLVDLRGGFRRVPRATLSLPAPKAAMKMLAWARSERPALDARRRGRASRALRGTAGRWLPPLSDLVGDVEGHRLAPRQPRRDAAGMTTVCGSCIGTTSPEADCGRSGGCGAISGRWPAARRADRRAAARSSPSVMSPATAILTLLRAKVRRRYASMSAR